MSRRTIPLTVLAVTLAAFAMLLPGMASAATTPGAAWNLSISTLPTNFKPGAVHAGGFTAPAFEATPQYVIVATNVGATPNADPGPDERFHTEDDIVRPLTINATLPPEVTPAEAEWYDSDENVGGTAVFSAHFPCVIAGHTVSCEDPREVRPGGHIQVSIPVDVAAISIVVDTQATLTENGVGKASAATSTALTSALPSFGFLPGKNGFDATLTEPDGLAATRAGSHPHQLTLNFANPTESGNPFPVIPGAGGLHELIAEFPRGVLVDPGATPVRCTEAQLVGERNDHGGCPYASQVGVISLPTRTTGFIVEDMPLFNMVPPPGVAAELAFDALRLGISTHILGGVMSDGDYGLFGDTSDILARAQTPIFGIEAQLWGDPSSADHELMRGRCILTPADALLPGEPCRVPQQSTPLLTMPSDCPASPIRTRASADSWNDLGVFKKASIENTDLEGNPAPTDGCNQLEFKPTISSKPTTNLADSPSGLDFNLHQPQDMRLEHLATANLKDATVTLPAGMSVNPSQADGLGACSEAQIGFAPKEGEIHFSKEPDSCPDAAKLGTVEVTSPLLAQYSDGGTKPQRDVEGNVIPEPLHGSVYLAEPFDNPFDSLVAIYLSIDDEKSGIVAKLAGKVIPDPVTGQLTTRFEENPELPLEDVALHLFGGTRGALLTPQTCGTHTTNSTLTPWSTPEGADAHPSDSFATTVAPDGGSCPTSPGAASNKLAFSAGTIAPVAGAYSPFVLKLSRSDGSQRLKEIEATLPPGLIGKLAGIATCSEAQIAAAKVREAPEQGRAEQASPSCPASSEVGTVDVGAGAGPTPLHVQGHAYLAGPYKGAPLSLAIITPGVAGPFDLGAVVVRAALYLDPATAQIHAVSDPLPQIIDGIPLDVRSIAMKMGRPDFTLNPTSCDPFSVSGSATSALGQSAALSSPFQVGGCKALTFKPKLNLRLKGGTKRAAHPKLIATLKAKPGEANIAKAQVKLPPSAFLDQAHIRTVCTRVQFAADACPKGSIYGKATATTPLLDYPISGNVYLRSSNNKLPDLIVALKGPESQPIEIDLAGRTDSVKGALRNTFDLVPDAPVSQFRLELFGGKRGLVVNSRNLCAHKYRATVKLDGQNGKVFDTNPIVSSDCARKPGPRRHREGGSHR